MPAAYVLFGAAGLLDYMQIPKELITKCKKGDSPSQFLLYKQCYSTLLGVSRRYYDNKEDAVAIMNQAFLKILTHIDRYDENSSFDGWIKKIMVNCIIDEYRKNKKIKANTKYFESNDTYLENLEVDFNDAELLLDAQHLLQCIHQLPNQYKEIFNLYAVDGFSHKEIASQLAISEGTSKWYLSEARKKLRMMITTLLAKEVSPTVNSQL